MRANKIDSVPFQYNHPLKTLWKQGKLPQVKIGLYNNKLTKKNVSLEHELPVSKGGKTIESNLRTLCDRCNLGKRDKIE